MRQLYGMKAAATFTQFMKSFFLTNKKIFRVSWSEVEGIVNKRDPICEELIDDFRMKK